MNTLKNRGAGLLIVCGMLLSLSTSANAWEPNTTDLDKAIKTADFTGYLANLSKWLDGKTPTDPAHIKRATLEALLKDPIFAKALSQRQFISKTGADNLAAFAKTDESNKTFLAWVLRTTEAMENCLDGVTPVGLQQRAAHLNVYPCFKGGSQVYCHKSGKSILKYDFDVPADGVYVLTMRTAAVNFDQSFDISAGGGGKWQKANIKVPNTHGLWGTTEGLDIELSKGRRTIWMSTPSQRGVALRWLELKLKTSGDTVRAEE